MIDTKKLRQRIQKDPVKHFYDEVLGCSHHELQDRITRAVFTSPYVSVASCHASGKTYIEPRISLAFLFAYIASKVITTAPTFRQVEDGIWREWHTTHSKSKTELGGKLLKTQYEIRSDWFATGVASENPDNFQGYHAEDLLAIIDEAGGVRKESQERIKGLLTSKNCHLLLMGNPTPSSGPFFDSFHGKGAELWVKIRITAFDTPNFLANGIKSMKDMRKFNSREELLALPLPFPALITPLWVWERMQDWGEESPIFQALVMAQFPQESEYTLIPLSAVCAALERSYTDEQRLQWPHNRAIGIDVARKGSNETVFTAMNHYEVIEIASHHGKDLMKTVGKAIAMFNELGFNKKQDVIVVDDTGLGGGVTDRLNELGFTVIPVNFGSKSDDVRFMNLKTEMYWNLRMMFLDEKIKIIDKGKVMGQVPTIEYEFNSQGVMSIQSKSKISAEKRLEMQADSPDYADSLALAAWGVRSGEVGSSSLTEGEEPESKETLAGNMLNEVF